MRGREPKLAFVVLDGTLHHVSEFVSLPVGQRPLVLCPQCDLPVTLRLGPERAHHAGHRPGALCALTAPETVLHLNVKAHLYAQLSGARRLYVYQRCDGWWAPDVGRVRGGSRECFRGRRPHLWLEDWDRVEMERFVGSRKPDLVFYRGGEAVAAVEVRATHAVDEQKRADLEAAGLPWIEVEASEELYAGEKPWTADEPLTFSAGAPPLPDWTCGNCLRLEAGYVERTLRAIAESEKGERQRLHEERLRREHRAAHERWKREEVIPYSVLKATREIANRSKMLRAPDGRTIIYTITQESREAEIMLRVDGFQVAFLPPPLDSAAKDRILALYEEHRVSLGLKLTDVTDWEPMRG